MRRPVKPFVTEYKGTNRRPGGRGGDDFFGASAVHEAVQRPGSDNGARPDARSDHARAENNRSENARSENAYEAALKAADALFAPPPKSADIGGPGPEPQGKDGAEATDTSASGRRILRAIDEPPLPGLAEAEEAEPVKRRGRKPGSKNKPKPVAAAALPLATTPEPDDEDLDDEDQLEVVEAPAAARPTVPYRPRTIDRFSWVRTRLKPGEQWKRRLPKVCW